ncbi:alpha/beta hydrolase [Agrobacterium sp. SORGH_AS 787]|uniref:alpha/beta hydrolase n=1 Tax=Agrobacterium sp. SORGH_AS 787 TaxID=3041775 RepID=UPI0027845CDC|nr:putative alpha/beta hydrolase family esterase [Rhizobium sp. SORGH_AS_0787]
MCTTLIVPGLNGSPPGHWQDHWLRDDPTAKLVDQDDWQCPVLEDWLTRFETALAGAEEAYVVAHSLGCLLIANMASRPLATRIKAALLVAPASLEKVEALHPCIVRFGSFPALTLPFPSLVVGSTTDPYMDAEEVAGTAGLWGSELVNLGAVGHLNIASGFGRWPQGYALFERLIRPTSFALDHSERLVSTKTEQVA